ncbi:hypothetical protein Ancab_010546 [Ancistrocladus abbreviatus]
MALAFLYHLGELWPFSALKVDDLKKSDRLVKKLAVPDQTKQFVFAIQEPGTGSIIYVISAQNLSESTARDVEYLIREVHPDAVFAQLGQSTMSEIQFEQYEPSETDDLVPTSALKVMLRCFMDKINKDSYENIAGNLVLKEIFGVGLYGHFHVAKRAAEEVGSSFFALESPVAESVDSSLNPGADDNNLQALALKWSGLITQNLAPIFSSGSKRFLIINDIQSQMVKSLSSCLASALANHSPADLFAEVGPDSIQPRDNYQPPSFAQAVYLLLVDLHNIFSDVPSMHRALAYAQKLFLDIERGEKVDARVLSEVCSFQIAVEGLRIALNNAGRLPMHKMGNIGSEKMDFSELSYEEKSHCLLAQALRSQTKNFKKIVAVVDVSCLSGLRKHWNTIVPPEVRDAVEQLVVNHQLDTELSKDGERKRLLTNNPVVAVGAGATAALGVSSLSKVVPASTVVKVVTLNVPASLKLFLIQTHKAFAIALSKVLGTSKVVAPGFASSGAKASTTLKAAVTAERIRVVTHSVIASAEKTSFSAMRTAFYEIMRKRRRQPVGFMPWATFGCSVATCAGLLVYGDGIECAAESLPTAHSIANLGRGIHSLQQASVVVRELGRTKIQKAIESLMYRIKRVKIQ